MEPSRAVFISYASDDAEPAARIAEALKAAGLQVWFDKNELRGGDVWDRAIRDQVKRCALFLPIISARTRARGEGYFRLEWRLAVDRSHLMASDQAFLVPVVIDGTSEADARVPEVFVEMQWTRLPGGEVTPEFVSRILTLLKAPVDSSASSVTAEQSPASYPKTQSAAPLSLAPPKTTRKVNRTPQILAAAVGIGAFAALTWHHLNRHVVIPYSSEDRRMTFALLPLAAPAGDSHAAEVAAATTDALQNDLEQNTLWVHAIPQTQVQSALRTASAPAALARKLHVHFLIRGSIVKAQRGYTAHLYTLDGETERELGNQDLQIPEGAKAPRWAYDIEIADGMLLFYGLQVEVKRAEPEPGEMLDVRDLTYRAYVGWVLNRASPRQGYQEANTLLRRALKLAPDDLLALQATAEINLCDCIDAWSQHPEEQQAIGANAVDRFLRLDPQDDGMTLEKASVDELRGRWDEALELAKVVLRREPDSVDALATEAEDLMHLGRPQEALPIADSLLEREQDQNPELVSLDADVHYAVGDYQAAADIARRAVAALSDQDLSNPAVGAVQLTLISADGQLGRKEAAKSAYAKLLERAPQAKTVTAIRQWIRPNADLANFKPLYEGLLAAGIPEH